MNWALIIVTAFCLLVAFPWEVFAAEKYRHGVASWMGVELNGRLMANGQPFDRDKLTCASWHYPLGTKLEVFSLESYPGKRVVVTVTDRGPARRLKREIDLSEAAFKQIGDLKRGLINVTVTKI